MNQQYDWINKNLQKLYPKVPGTLLHLIPALFRQDDCGRSQIDKPAWLDLEKYRKGQKFVRDYYTSIIMTTMFSILHTYSFGGTINPIILGARSHTPYLAFKRYLSTQYRIQSWYDEELWVKGTRAYENMQFVRKIHKMMWTKTSKLTNDKYQTVCTFANPWCPDRELLLKDFATADSSEEFGQLPFQIFANSPYKPKPLNHTEIAAIQYAFMGIIVFRPNEVGVHGATDEEFESFCHIWRYYGYLLGIDEEYNFCRGNLEEIRQRIRDLSKYWIIPGLKYASPEWEHMTRCIIESFNYFPMIYMPYKSAMMLDMDVLGVNMSNLYASFSYSEWITYQVWKFILRYILKSSYIRTFLNNMANNLLIQLKNLSSEKEKELQERSKERIDDFSITNGNC